MPHTEADILTWFRKAVRKLGALALLALLVRAIVPGGYMLAAADTPDGRFVVMQLCDAHGQAVSALNLDTGELVDVADLPQKAPADNNSDKPPCAFAAAAVGVPPSAIGAPALTPVVALERPVIAYVQPGRGLPAPPPPATGPPSTI